MVSPSVGSGQTAQGDISAFLRDHQVYYLAKSEPT